MTGDLTWFSSALSGAWGILFMVVLLGGSIFVHELGHFLAARWRGLKVDRFSLGFGPKIFGWKGKDGTEYRVSWLPFGGYVALPQLADVRAIEGDPSVEPQNLPRVGYGDKIIVVLAGVVFNLLFALAIAVVLWPWGVPVQASSDSQVIGYVYPTLESLRGEIAGQFPGQRRARHAPPGTETPAPAYVAGLRPGDRIIAVDGSPIANFRELEEAVALSAGRDDQGRPLIAITYERGNVTQTTNVLPALVSPDSTPGDAIRQIGIEPADNLVVDDTADNSPARHAGLKPGDQVVAANGQPIYSVPQLNDVIDQNPTTPLVLTVHAGGASRDVTLTPVLVPITTPLATVTLGTGANAAQLDLLPIYPRDSSGDPALPATPAEQLIVWQIDGQPGAFGEMQPGDFLQFVNGRKVASVQEFVDAMRATPTGQAAVLDYESQSQHEEDKATLPPPLSASVTPPQEIPRLGIAFHLETLIEHKTPWAQFAEAFRSTLGMLGGLLNPHSDIGINHLTGPIGIGRILYLFSLDDLRKALWLTFVININLAIINLMPIPVLDGGHVLLFTIGWLRRRDLPVNFIAAAQAVCLVLILSLVAYVFFNDSRRWIGDNSQQREFLREDNYYIDEHAEFAPAAPVAPASNP
jgi:regulator of sigma E protease